MIAQTQKRRIGLCGSALLVAVGAATAWRSAQAVDYTWDGGGGSDGFDNPANWNPFGFPNDSNDSAIFSLASTYPVHFYISGSGNILFTNRDFEVRAGKVTFDLYTQCICADSTATYRLDPAGSLAATIGMANGVSSTLIVDGRDPNLGAGTIRGDIDAQGDMRIASVAGSIGRVDLGVTNNIGSALWTSTGSTQVGSGGSGTLNIFQSSSLIDAGGQIGVGDTGVGTVNVRGEWTNNGDLFVGLLGDGDLNLILGLVDTTGNASVGAAILGTSPSGRADLTGGDWSIGGTLTVGGIGPGTININSSQSELTVDGTMTARDLGTVNVTAGTLTAAGALTLQANSSLNLNGGRLKTSPATFTIPSGTFNWTSGTLEFTTGYTIQTGHILGGSSLTVGANKQFVVDGSLNVGASAAGTLSLNGGSTTTSDSANIGGVTGAGTTATATVTAAGTSWTIAHTLTVSDETAANFTVSAGALVNTTTLFASSLIGGSHSNIDVTGANTLWTNAGSAYLGGGTIASVGAGTLDITSSARMTIGNLLKVWEPFTVTLNGGALETVNLDCFGTLNATGTGTLKTSGAVNIFSASHMTFSPGSTFDLTGAAVNLAGASTLIGDVTGDAATSITVSSAGTTWTMPGSLEVGTASAGLGHVGSLSLQAGTTTNVANSVTILDASKFTFAGATLNAVSVELGSQDFTGFGTINANFHTAGSVTATGNLTLGNLNSLVGAVIGGTLNVGANTVTINKKGFYSIGNLTNIAGGTLVAPNGVAISVGNSLTAFGTVDARVVAQSGSLIEATGNLTLGSAASPAGFFSDGELTVNQHTVTINDANEALLGSLTTLGNGALPGTLSAASGAVVEFGKNIVGYGTVNTPNDPTKPLVNNGSIWGTSAGQPITLTGYVKGVGDFDNVIFTGTHSPGFSPATLYMHSAAYGSAGTLLMELGGTSAGQFDRLIFSGTATLGGTLRVELINPFVPALGNSFDLFDGSLSGTFANLNLPVLTPGLQWNTSALYSAGVISVVTGPAASEWKPDADGSWGTPDNWIGSIPDSPGAGANFLSAITAPRTVTLDGDRKAGNLVFDNAESYTITGPGSLTLDNAGAPAGIEVTKGSHTIAAPMTLAGETSITVDTGAQLSVQHLRGKSLTIKSGLVRIIPEGGKDGASSLAGLEINADAALDLADNDLVIREGDLSAVTVMIAAGRNVGAWDGAGIRSSTAAAYPGGLTGLGVILNTLGYTEFTGQEVDSDDVLVKYTWNGDTDLTGVVDADDYFRIDSGFASAGGLGGWLNGDFDFSGGIDADDYFLIDAAFAGQTGVLGGMVGEYAHPTGVAAVPEPGVMGAMVGVIGLLGRRRWLRR